MVKTVHGFSFTTDVVLSYTELEEKREYTHFHSIHFVFMLFIVCFNLCFCSLSVFYVGLNPCVDTDDLKTTGN